MLLGLMLVTSGCGSAVTNDTHSDDEAGEIIRVAEEARAERQELDAEDRQLRPEPVLMSMELVNERLQSRGERMAIVRQSLELRQHIMELLLNQDSKEISRSDLAQVHEALQGTAAGLREIIRLSQANARDFMELSVVNSTAVEEQQRELDHLPEDASAMLRSSVAMKLHQSRRHMRMNRLMARAMVQLAESTITELHKVVESERRYARLLRN
jgi:hypothetical protein